jgi:anti-sigma regulatory factor (Ser/Thr protein kinase)
MKLPESFDYTLPARIERLDSLLDEVDQFLLETEANESCHQLIRLTLEELVSNIIQHGFAQWPDAERDASYIHIKLTPGTPTTLEIQDNAAPFNPLYEAPPPP